MGPNGTPMMALQTQPSLFAESKPIPTEIRQLNSKSIADRLPLDLYVMPRKDYRLFSEDPRQGGFQAEGVKGIFTQTEFSREFFSDANVGYLQNAIRMSVFVQTGGQFSVFGFPVEGSGHLVGTQSPTELMIIMRSIMAQYSRNPRDCDSQGIADEIARLNVMILNYCVPNIITNVESHLGYLYDASHLPEPLEHSVLMSNRGTKMQRSITDILGGEPQ